ncbi:MFS transporter [Amycolatopsis jiangsuensis]|uniref:Putative MFS family arabinose efflux permease n=1 Tax=Amycolatopsis jiangsuensis TaxID=1181879 RepID=A0A840IXG0_9PSEU|nr:MFS transporter [Amycolatopsis jiangsuensis]MBB4685838.1 putative MFS family arabinose efflux permease [Amycolatopsis jiangsuensis]
MTTTAPSFRNVFGVGEFRALWVAHVLSVAGDQLARVALTVLVFDRTESAGWAAGTYALTYLPDLLGGALGGLADRFPRRSVLVVADVLRAVLVAAMAIPAIPWPLAAGLLVLVQLAAGPFQAARQAVLPDLLGEEKLPTGQAILSSTYQAALVVGFGAGAAVVTWLGVSGALWVDAVTFAVSAAALRWGLRPYPVTTVVERTPQWASLVAGCRLVARDRKLRSLLAIACCCGFYVVPEGLAVPVAAQLGGTGVLGWLLVANPVGTLLGALLISRLPRARQIRWLGPLAVASSLVLLPTGWTPALPVLVVLWTVSGACSAHDLITQVQYSLAAPPGQRGQVIGVAIAALRAAQGLGIIVAGALTQAFTPTTVVAIAGVAGALCAAVAGTAWARAVRPRRSPLDGATPPPAQ